MATSDSLPFLFCCRVKSRIYLPFGTVIDLLSSSHQACEHQMLPARSTFRRCCIHAVPTLYQIVHRLRGCWDIQIRKSVCNTDRSTNLTVPPSSVYPGFQAVSNDQNNCIRPSTCNIALPPRNSRRIAVTFHHGIHGHRRDERTMSTAC